MFPFAPQSRRAMPGRVSGRVVAATPAIVHAGARTGLFAFGLLCLSVGVVGAFVPFVPSTVFLLLALWAFSRSSRRFHGWLYGHPRFGKPLRDWQLHRVIPVPAKIAAVAMMATSLTIFAVFVADGWVEPLALGAVLAAVAAYIFSRPHSPP
ncbi:MAG: DUF454 domain-containing protein [Alphaproteobacteria bacterium]|nr:MAG: DUF454 domain-containing protein [Alphaproteobacteria bacterium]